MDPSGFATHYGNISVLTKCSIIVLIQLILIEFLYLLHLCSIKLYILSICYDHLIDSMITDTTIYDFKN